MTFNTQFIYLASLKQYNKLRYKHRKHGKGVPPYIQRRMGYVKHIQTGYNF